MKKLLKWCFYLSVNTNVYNPMMLFMINIHVFITLTPFMVKMVFLFSVNAYVDIPMMVFMIKIFLKVVKNTYTGE